MRRWAGHRPRDREPRATLDFETRSAASIMDVGTWRYAEHPTTEVLCLCYRLPHWDEGRVDAWHPAFPDHGVAAVPEPKELFRWIESGGLLEAHSVQMELAVWVRKMLALGWPDLRRDRLRCSAAKAAAHALPRALEDCARVLETPHQKDMVGSKVMLKLAKPRKPRKAERVAMEARGVDPKSVLLWHFDAALLERLIDYCRLDVLAEEDVSSELPDLDEAEQEVFLVDLAANERGALLDERAVRTALAYVDEVCSSMSAELPALTGSLVTKASQRARIKEWVNERGVYLPDTQATTVEQLLDQRADLPADVRRVLEVCREVNRTSTAKYVAASERACSDWRVRGMCVYHGASTGRWTGSGLQPHNFPRGGIKDMDLAWEMLLADDRDWAELLYGDMMELLSHATRGMLVAPDGMQLYVADFSAIEARVVFWLASETAALVVLRSGKCIYCDLASEIFGFPVNKDDHPNQRQLGKQGILGLGFGMGAPKFQETCATKADIVIELPFAQQIVRAYRDKYRNVLRMWFAQEEAAIEAVLACNVGREPCSERTLDVGPVVRASWKRPDGVRHTCDKLSWQVEGRFLRLRLPSGRKLSYCDPQVRPYVWNGLDKRELTFMAVDPYTRKWRRQSTWGGTLIENAVQATARDLLAASLVRAERHPALEVAFHVHDELVCYGPQHAMSRRDYEALVAETPDWASGCPVSAEGWIGGRYRK